MTCFFNYLESVCAFQMPGVGGYYGSKKWRGGAVKSWLPGNDLTDILIKEKTLGGPSISPEWQGLVCMCAPAYLTDKRCVFVCGCAGGFEPDPGRALTCPFRAQLSILNLLTKISTGPLIWWTWSRSWASSLLYVPRGEKKYSDTLEKTVIQTYTTS